MDERKRFIVTTSTLQSRRLGGVERGDVGLYNI